MSAVADALRAQARVLEALADELDGAAAPDARPAKKSAPRRRGPARVERPADVTDIDVAKARALARRAGLRVEG